MRMLQLRRDLDLSAKSVAIHARRELRRENFHDDFTPKRAIDGDEHATHATACQLVVELIVGAQGSLELFSESVAHSTVKEFLTAKYAGF